MDGIVRTHVMQPCSSPERKRRETASQLSLLGRFLFVLLVAATLGAQQDRARKSDAKGAPAATAAAPVEPNENVRRFLGEFRSADGIAIVVRADVQGTGLVAFGADAASAVLLATGKPAADAQLDALKAAEARVQKALVPMLARRGEPDESQFAGAQAVAAVAKSLDALRARLGASGEALYAGSDLQARSTWVLLRGASGSTFAVVRWSASGKVVGLEAIAAEPPTAVRLAVPRRDWAVGSGPQRGLTMSVEGRSAGRTLVLEDAMGLVACAWKADVR